MKRIITILCAVSALLLTSCSVFYSVKADPEPGQKHRKAKITVESFNVRIDTRKDNENAWDYRKAGALAMLQSVKPDLLGLQEAQKHQLNFILSGLPEYKWYGLGRDKGKKFTNMGKKGTEECMAILYNTKTMKMLDCGTFWLSETPDQVSYGWDAACRRTCTWAKFQVLRNGEIVYYFNTHLDHKGHAAREESMKLIADKIKEINPRGYITFLTADFNSTTDDVIFNPLKKQMLDARVDAVRTDHHNTFHDWQGGRGTKVIDHIWYSGPNCEPLQFKTITDAYAGIKMISDHYPVITRFEVR